MDNNEMMKRKFINLTEEIRYFEIDEYQIRLPFAIVNIATAAIIFPFGLYLFLRKLGHPYQFYGLQILFSPLFLNA